MRVKDLEKQVWYLEGFAVRVRYRGRDARSDRTMPLGYNCTHEAAGTWTVQQWKVLRFKTCFPDYDADVLLADGREATEGMTLASVRATYRRD